MQCPICDSEKAVLIEEGIRNDPDGKIWRCVCGLEYLDPQPTADSLAEYYASEYRADSKPMLDRFFKNVYEAVRRGDMLDMEETTRLLEVGSGSGAFLALARTVLENPCGVEPDEKSWRWIADMNGITVYKGVYKLPEHDRFDLIVMFHTLEHLPDPVGFLEMLKGKLAENGKIVVEVPNADDIMLRNSAYRKKYFYQKAHLWYFDWWHLRKILTIAGFRDVRISTIQRYNLRSRLRWIFKRRNNGDGLPADLTHGWLSKLYANRLIARGRTDTLWAVGG